MSWVTIIWSMVASACLTLAAMHLLVWSRRRTAWAHLLFSLSAAGTAAYAGCELWMMRAQTPGDFGLALRWAYVPAWVLVVSVVAFVRVYLRAGRPWLAGTVCGVLTVGLLLDFGSAPNLSYLEISALRHVRFLGDTVSVVADGVRNPWMPVGQLGLLLLAVFVADASIGAWRRGDRRQALMVGGSIAFFAVGATLEAVLVLGGLVQEPLTATLLYAGVLAAMAYQLSDDVLRAARATDDLRQREQQIALVADAADLGLWIWTTPPDTVWATERLNPMLGFAPGELISVVSFLEHVHPEDRGLTRQALQRALDDASDYSAEYRVVLPDGRQRWIAASGRVERPTRDAAVRAGRVHGRHHPQAGRDRDAATAG
jgi:two-component system sensor kinase FixL